MKRTRQPPARPRIHQTGSLLTASIRLANLSADRYWVCRLATIGRDLLADDCGMSSYRARRRARELRADPARCGVNDVMIVHPHTEMQ